MKEIKITDVLQDKANKSKLKFDYSGDNDIKSDYEKGFIDGAAFYKAIADGDKIKAFLKPKPKWMPLKVWVYLISLLTTFEEIPLSLWR